MDVARVFLARGDGSEAHAHSEEQTVFVEEGRLEVVLGEGESAETYVVEPGQASFHPSGVTHRLSALEDTWVVSFKNTAGSVPEPESGRLE